MKKKWYQTMAAICVASVLTVGNGLPLQKVSAKTVVSQKKTLEEIVTDPVEDGEYTLTFQAKAEGSEESSMLGSYFDPKVKLTVKDHTMQITMRNIKLADFLLDFSVASGENFVNTQKTGVGEKNSSGNYDQYDYTMSITKPSEVTKAGALVSAMGGQISDIGDFSKYIKADFSFTSIAKGWSGYEIEKSQEPEDPADVLNQALIDYGLDKDNDGKVTPEEVSQFPGDKMDLSGYGLTDISLLRYLPSTVTELNLSENKIAVIPEGLLDGMTGLENFYIEHNNVTEIPKGLFKNNAKLNWISFTGNKLTQITDGTFAGLETLDILDLEGNEISKVEKNAFQGMPKVTQLSLIGNNLSTLPEGCLTPVAGSLKMLFIQENQFTTLPKAVSECTELTDLNAYSNEIEDVSQVDFSKLPKLQEINLMCNKIREIPENAFAQNKKLDGLDLYDNQLTSLSPDTLPQGANLRKLDVRLNNINVVDKKLIAKSQSFNKFYPQKAAMNFKLEKDGVQKLKWSQDLSILDILFWYDETNDAKITEIASVEEYEEFLKENGYADQKLVDVLNSYNYDWDIVTKVQKKNAEGQFETIFEETNQDQEEVMSGAFAVSEDGVYRVVKELYSSTSGMKNYRFTAISNEYEYKTSDSKEEQPAAKPEENRKNENPEKSPSAAGNTVAGTTAEAKTTETEAVQTTKTETNVASSSKAAKKSAKPKKIKKFKKKKTTKSTVVLSWKKQSGVDGYEVYRAEGKKGSYQKMNQLKKAERNQYTAGKLKAGKQYRFKVRAYRMVSGKKVYGAFSKVLIVKIKK